MKPYVHDAPLRHSLEAMSAPQAPQVYSEERPLFANGKQTKLFNDMQDYVGITSLVCHVTILLRME